VANRARDWLEQALRDLAQAEDSRKAGRHEWACFAAQQAAEKAVKAFFIYRRATPTVTRQGHRSSTMAPCKAGRR
jgi:HEPN domain-containing protein